MQRQRPLILLVTALTIALAFGFLTTATPLFAASKEKVLHSFGKGKDGVEPFAGLIFDAAGNLYGTTSEGGTGPCKGGNGLPIGCGTVFELMPGAHGNWTEKVLHSFQLNDGAYPQAGLIFDTAGNLYGTTWGGGAYLSCDAGLGCGTVFELTPNADGKWSEKVLHSFGRGEDGLSPAAGLVFDTVGNLYGTTLYDGQAVCFGACGMVFRLTPKADNEWTETVVHYFSGPDGAQPNSSLIFDDRWTEQVLHSFDGPHGAYPVGNLIFDAAGNLYGTTLEGGAHSYGTVFQLAQSTNGTWQEKVLRSFYRWRMPEAGLTLDAAGNLYGATSGGGSHDLEGTIFKFVPGTNGNWTYAVVYSFNLKKGSDPLASLAFDTAGNMYGTTAGGGAYGYGTVFEFTP